MQLGYRVSPVMDRNYFHSIYYRKKGSVLVDIATNPPGFGVDEPVDELGSPLRLPAWMEPMRGRIEGMLPRVDYGECTAPVTTIALCESGASDRM